MAFPIRTPSSLRTVAPPSEAVFVDAQEGNPEAWQALADRYSGTLARHLRKRTGDPTLTKQVVDRALTEGRDRIRECETAAEFPRWLRGVADDLLDAKIADSSD